MKIKGTTQEDIIILGYCNHRSNILPILSIGQMDQ